MTTAGAVPIRRTDTGMLASPRLAPPRPARGHPCPGFPQPPRPAPARPAHLPGALRPEAPAPCCPAVLGHGGPRARAPQQQQRSFVASSGLRPGSGHWSSCPGPRRPPRPRTLRRSRSPNLAAAAVAAAAAAQEAARSPALAPPPAAHARPATRQHRPILQVRLPRR